MAVTTSRASPLYANSIKLNLAAKESLNQALRSSRYVNPLTKATPMGVSKDVLSSFPASPSPSSPAIPHERGLITQLLSLFKQTSEVRQYLKYYGNVDSDRFAVIKISGDVLKNDEEVARIASSLAFLRRIGLVPIVVHGAGIFSGRQSSEVLEVAHSTFSSPQERSASLLRAAESHMIKANNRLVSAIENEGVSAAAFIDGVFITEPDTESPAAFNEALDGLNIGYVRRVNVDAISEAVAAGRIPIVAAMGHDETGGGNAYTFSTQDAALALTKVVQPLKVIWLRPEGGLKTSSGEMLNAVDLSRDAPSLLEIDELAEEYPDALPAASDVDANDTQALVEACVADLDVSTKDAESLVELATFHRVLDQPGSTVSVTTPDGLAAELFTNKGNGTMVIRGERVFAHTTLDHLDLPRLYNVISAAFGAPLPPNYVEDLAAQGKIKRIYVTEEYRGAAIILNLHDTAAAGISYLDKFAVDKSAQGDKLGEVLWKAMVQREKSLFWRSKSANRVNPWYYEQSTGCYKSVPQFAKPHHAPGQWTVFWREVDESCINDCIDTALSLPVTFKSNSSDPKIVGDSSRLAGIPSLK